MFLYAERTEEKRGLKGGVMVGTKGRREGLRPLIESQERILVGQPACLNGKLREF